MGFVETNERKLKALRQESRKLSELLDDIFDTGHVMDDVFKNASQIAMNIIAVVEARLSEECQLKDGKYIFHQNNCQTVEMDVTFDSEGNIKTATDASNVNWREWLISYKALDPNYPNTRLELVK